MGHLRNQRLLNRPETGNHSCHTEVYQTHTQEVDPCTNAYINARPRHARDISTEQNTFSEIPVWVCRNRRLRGWAIPVWKIAQVLLRAAIESGATLSPPRRSCYFWCNG